MIGGCFSFDEEGAYRDCSSCSVPALIQVISSHRGRRASVEGLCCSNQEDSTSTDSESTLELRNSIISVGWSSHGPIALNPPPPIPPKTSQISHYHGLLILPFCYSCVKQCWRRKKSNCEWCDRFKTSAKRKVENQYQNFKILTRRTHYAKHIHWKQLYVRCRGVFYFFFSANGIWAAKIGAFKRLKFWPVITADGSDQENCISSALAADSQTKIIA